MLQYNAVRCVFCTVLGLLLGSIYYRVGLQLALEVRASCNSVLLGSILYRVLGCSCHELLPSLSHCKFMCSLRHVQPGHG